MTHEPVTHDLRARWVLPVAGPPLDGGVVRVVEERIESVGRAPDNGVGCVDLGDVAIIPGLVNAHTHLELSALAAPLGTPDMSFPEWIRLVVAARRTAPDSFSPARRAAAYDQGWRESLRCGVTLLGDIASLGVAPPIAERARSVVTFVEAIGFTLERSRAALQSVREMVASSPANEHDWLGLSPHAPYTVRFDLLRGLIKLARAALLPVAMHVAESPEESQLLAAGSGPFVELLQSLDAWDAAAIPRGASALDYLAALALAPRSLVIHGNYLTDEDAAFLAQRRDRMSLVHCPRTHAYFGHERYPLARRLEQGVRMALGTDSRASNPDLDLLAEMRHVALRHAEIAPKTILELGTLAGAQALGRGPACGSLEAGKLANLAVVPLSAGSADPHAAILSEDAHVSRTMLCGAWLNEAT